MIEALALEVRDNWEGIEEVGGLREFPGAKSAMEENEVATVVRYILETQPLDSDVEEDDDD